MSKDFPCVNGYNDELTGYEDFFLTKLNPQGTGAVYSTFFGGNDQWGEGYIYDFLVDENNRPTITGYTGSYDYPTTSGVYNENMPSGSKDSSFITIFSSSG